MPRQGFEVFFRSYLECAVWSSTDDAGKPLDRRFGPKDIESESLAKMRAECERFYTDHAEDINEQTLMVVGRDYGPDDLAGHDFWLTRNGHGAGFWDGDWEDDVGKRLTAASKKYRECYLFENGQSLYLA